MLDASAVMPPTSSAARARYSITNVIVHRLTNVMQPRGAITHVKTIAERLVHARERAGLTQEQLAAAARVSQGTIGNIESGLRKRPRDIIAIADAVGVRPQWLETGKGPIDVSASIPLESNLRVEGIASHAAEAQTVSQWGRRVLPTARTWESLMQGPLEPEFQTTMPDASMAPEIRRGATMVFITGVSAAPGDFVLVADQQGVHYVREYRMARGQAWEAHALNPAYPAMHSERDGLQVLAVCNGVLGRRSER